VSYQVLKADGIKISMDGKGRWIDNVFVERLWRSVKCEPTSWFPKALGQACQLAWPKSLVGSCERF
jgi:transposase InsO family protein